MYFNLSAIVFITKGNHEPVPNWVGIVFIALCLAAATFAFLNRK
jgi:hypothetical protein